MCWHSCSLVVTAVVWWPFCADTHHVDVCVLCVRAPGNGLEADSGLAVAEVMKSCKHLTSVMLAGMSACALFVALC